MQGRLLCRSFSGIASTATKRARIVEVGLRDGLQNEKTLVSLDTKLQLLDKLYAAGLRDIEAGAFVSPQWVPQMKDTKDIFTYLKKEAGKYPGATFSALVPNAKGLQGALDLQVAEIAIFGAASEAFSQKNINCSIKDSIKRFAEVTTVAHKHNIKVRGYVSTVVGCPYDGPVEPQKVLEVSKALLDLGCYEISLGDTIGVGNAGSVQRLLDVVCGEVPVNKLAVHFHDTYGQALANIYTAYTKYGITAFDSSVSGLGGCPYAKGASGNVATEDVVYMLHGMGVQTGVDMDKLLDAAEFIDQALNKPTASKSSLALRNKREKK